MTNAKTAIKIVCVVLGLTMLLLVLATTGTAVLVIKSEYSRVYLVDAVVTLINDGSDYHIDISGLASARPEQLRAKSIRVSSGKPATPLVHIQNMYLQWQPKGLLNSNLIVDKLSASSVTLYPAPEKATPSTDNNTDYIKLLKSLPGIEVTTLDIATLIIASDDQQSIEPELLEYHLNAQLTLMPHQPPYANISLRSSHDQPLKLSIQATTDENDVISVVGSINDQAGALLADKLPKEIPAISGVEFSATIEHDPSFYQIHFGTTTFSLDDLPARIDSALKISSDLNEIEIDHFEITLADHTHSISGSLKDNQVDAQLTLDTFALRLTAPWTAPITTGNLSANVSISGSLDDPTLQGDIQLSTHIHKSNLEAQWRGQASLNLIDTQSLTVTMDDSSASASGIVNLTEQQLKTAIELRNVNSNQLKPWGIDIPGNINLHVTSAAATLNGAFTNPDGNLTLVATATKDQDTASISGAFQKIQQQVTISELEIKPNKGRLRANGIIDLDLKNNDIEVSAKNFNLDNIKWLDLTLPADIKGQVGGQLQLTGLATNPSVKGAVDFTGHYQQLPLHVELKGHRNKNDIAIESMSLDLDGNRLLQASGVYNPQKVDIFLESRRLPTRSLTSLGANLNPGLLDLELRLSGKAQAPQLNGQLRYDLEPVNNDGGNETSHYSAIATIRTREETLDIDTHFTRNEAALGQLTTLIPLAPYSDIWLNQALPDDKLLTPLHATVQANMDLQPLSSFINADMHRISGQIDSTVKLSGTLKDPRFSGVIDLTSANYENTLLGTQVRKINCHINISNHQASISQCDANDSNSGRYNISGDAQLPTDDSNGNIDLSIKVDHVNIIRRPDIESQTTGEFRLKGDFDEALASGHMNIAPLDISTEASWGDSIPAIEIEKEVLDTPNAREPALKLPRILLDLTFSADQKAYVRGRGLDAELQGSINVRGDTKNPNYYGQFKTVRGHLEVFGKRFTLQEGQADVANNSVSFTVPSVYEKDGTTIYAELYGTEEEIKIRLSSIPSMPEDEILAFIIFGKALQKITPFEAVRLAGAIQTLRGGKPFFDPVGSARDILGVDTIAISSESDGLNVGVGKYINEKVYLEIERNPNPSQPWRGNVKIEVTPSVNLETSTGGSSGIEGAEIKWKHDY